MYLLQFLEDQPRWSWQNGHTCSLPYLYLICLDCLGCFIVLIVFIDLIQSWLRSCHARWSCAFQEPLNYSEAALRWRCLWSCCWRGGQNQRGNSSTRIWLICPPQTHYSVETHVTLDSEWESMVLPAFQFWGGGSVWSAWHQQHASDCGMGFCVCCSPPLASPKMKWEQKLGSESKARKHQYIFFTVSFRDPNKESPSSKLLNYELFSKCGTSTCWAPCPHHAWNTMQSSCLQYSWISSTSLMLLGFHHHPSSSKTRNHPLVCWLPWILCQDPVCGLHLCHKHDSPCSSAGQTLQAQLDWLHLQVEHCFPHWNSSAHWGNMSDWRSNTTVSPLKHVLSL